MDKLLRPRPRRDIGYDLELWQGYVSQHALELEMLRQSIKVGRRDGPIRKAGQVEVDIALYRARCQNLSFWVCHQTFFLEKEGFITLAGRVERLERFVAR